MKLINWLMRRKPKADPSPEDRLRAAVAEFNDAWQEYEACSHWRDRLRPWLEWSERRLILTRLTHEEVK